MRNDFARLTAALLIAGSLSHAAVAAEDDATARLKEMIRRTQEALRQAKAENAELTRAKSEAEQKAAAATHDIASAQAQAKTAQAAVRTQQQSSLGAQAELTRKLAENTALLNATNAKLVEAAKLASARDSELAQLRQNVEQGKAATVSCEDKNLKLYGYAQEVLQRYKNKGVWTSLAEKEPVFGLKSVDAQNVVQEYQAKFSAEKIRP